MYRVCCLFLVIATWSCHSKKLLPEQVYYDQILDLHNAQREMHFQKLVDDFADLLAENHISVNRGVISAPTREENVKRFGSYFDAVEFEKWDDITPPIIRFSDDYSLAYTIVHKEVILRYNHDGRMTRERTEYAWSAIYRKTDGEWKIESVASTNLPTEELDVKSE